jgi:hypothetical protein
MFEIIVYDGLAQSRSVSNVSHLRPVIVGDRVEAADRLPSRVVSDERDFARYIDLAFLFGNILLLRGNRLWTVATAVVDDVFSIPKESRMPVQMYFTVFWLVPFGVEKQIFGVKQLLDLLGMKLGTVGNSLS